MFRLKIISFAICSLAFILAPVDVAHCQSKNQNVSEKKGKNQLVQQGSAGHKIYETKCLSCHGQQGRGSKEYTDSLHGDLSIEDLASYIADSMPEEDPDLCVGDDARAVAEFIHKSFYSAAAQRRLLDARVELSRLTVRQYQESVADLAIFFGHPIWIPEERGLKANYFAARRWTADLQISEQVDENIDFANGVLHFDPHGKYEVLKKRKKKKGENDMNVGFSVFWDGGIVATETGRYEIVVESLNGFELFINDTKNRLIDRRVRSDSVQQHSASINLVGGRPYSFKLELFAYPDPPAKIRVLWKPPGQRLAVIPPSAFIRFGTTETLAIKTAFPADDASHGYKRGISVSAQWDEATTNAAIEVANWVASRIEGLAKTKLTDDDAAMKVKSFCHKFVSRAFVEKLTKEERKFYVDQHFENDLALQDQLKRVVILALKSPKFLYPAASDRNKEFEVARQMGLTLWDSLPDDRVYEMARKGQLSKQEKLMGELYRMVEDPRSKSKLHAFFQYWLETERAAEVSKDKDVYPDFDEAIVSDLRKSLELYLEDVVWNEASDFRDLFLADYLFVNKRLAEFYGFDVNEELKNENQFVKLKVDPKTRAGILTHPYLMTGLAYHKDSSPIHRGVFVAKQLLGRRLRQPPDNVEPLTEEFDPEMTNRERVEHQTKETACMNCHSVINPLGFTLENFDAVGRFRKTEKEKKIDVATVYKTPEGAKVEFDGPRALASFLAENEMAQRSFVRQLFNHYSKQSIDAYGEEQLDRLHRRFADGNFNVRNLLVDIALVTINYELD